MYLSGLAALFLPGAIRRRLAGSIAPRALRVARASHSLAVKLTLAFLIVSLVGTGLAALFIRWATTQAFDRLVIDQAQAVSAANASSYFTSRGSWSGVASQDLSGPPLALSFSIGSEPPAGPGAPAIETLPAVPGGSTAQPGPVARYHADGEPGLSVHSTLPAEAAGVQSFSVVLLSPDRRVIVPGGVYRLGEAVPADASGQETPVIAGGQVVGTVFATGEVTVLDPFSERYLTRTNLALLYGPLIGVAIALMLGVLLARAMAGPLAELTVASRAVAAGHLDQQVPVRSEDELGDLAAAFNQMSAALSRANALQRQMVADIAHELRSPLTVLTGYLEGLRDGVIKPSAARFAALHDEAQQLARLVEDLRTLSLADAGALSLARQPVAALPLLARVADAFSPRAVQAGITLQVCPAGRLPDLDVDPERIVQVLSNLVGNALRYTPSGGTVTLAAAAEDRSILLHVDDTGQGIPADMLSHVFERFYRGDGSRSQQGDESGLGLAIARSIVEAHGGTIRATSEGPGRGARFTLRLPAQRSPS